MEVSFPSTLAASGSKRLRVMLGDDHTLILNGIKTLLEPHCDVVGTATDGRSLVHLALEAKPDLVVLDVSMPHLNGLDAALQIKAASPATKIIFLSMHTNPMYLRKALENGAQGYVLKTGVVEELLEAIQQVLKGETYFSPGFGRDVTTTLLNCSGKPSREETELTARQREILQLIAEGHPAKEIAHLVGISIKTVEFHRTRMMARVGAHSIGELVRIAMEQGLIPVTTPGIG